MNRDNRFFPINSILIFNIYLIFKLCFVHNDIKDLKRELKALQLQTFTKTLEK